MTEWTYEELMETLDSLAQKGAITCKVHENGEQEWYITGTGERLLKEAQEKGNN